MGERERVAAAQEGARAIAYRSGVFRVDLLGNTLTRNGEAVSLTPKCFDLLVLLMRNHQRLVPSAEIFEAIWPGITVTPANLRQQMFSLRQALGDGENAEPSLIVNVPSRGYRFAGPVEVETEPGAGEPMPPEPAVATRPPRRPPFLTALVLIGTALAVAGGYAILSRRNTGKPSDAASQSGSAQRRSIAVLGFKNLSARPEDRWMSSALAEMLSVELAVGGELRTVPDEVVARARADLALTESVGYAADTLRKIRANLGVGLVLCGSYLRVSEQGAGRIRLDLAVQDTESGDTVLVASESGEAVRLLDLVSQAGMTLRRRLSAEGPAREAPTGSLAGFPRDPTAMAKYAEGVGRLRRFDPPLARELLDQAATIEPDSAMIQSALAETWMALGYRQKAMEAAAKARELRTGLPRARSLLIDAQYYAARGEWDKAAECFAELHGNAPDDLEHGLKLAAAYREARSAEDALKVVERLRRLKLGLGTDPRIEIEESRNAFILSQYSRAIDASRRAAASARAISSPVLIGTARIEEGRALSASGNPQPAMAAFEEASKMFQSAGDIASLTRALVELGRLTLNGGDPKAALDLFARANAGSSKIGDQRGCAATEIGTGAVLTQMGDRTKALPHLQNALAIYREIGDKRNAAIALHNVASVEVAMGKLSNAAASYEEAAAALLEGGLRSGAGTALGSLARLRLRRGEMKKASDAAKRAGELLDGKGNTIDVLWYKTLLVEIALERADLPAARDAIAAMEALVPASGSELHRGLSRQYLAECLLAAGQESEAKTKLDEARKIYVAAGQMGYAAGCDILEARIELAAGRSSAATALAARATQAVGDVSVGQDAVASLAFLARCRATHGSTAAARKDADRAWAAARSGEDVLVRLSVVADVAAVVAAGGDREEAIELLTRSSDEAARRELTASGFRIDLELAGMLVEAGRAVEASARIEALVARAEQRGYVSVARRARELIAP